MYHRNYTTYLQKELDFLRLLVTRFHEQEKVNGLELDVALSKTQDIYGQLLRMKITPEEETEAVFTPEKVFVPELAVKKEHAQKLSEPPTELVSSSKPEIKLEPAKAGILAEKISPSDFHPINETLAQQKPVNDLSSKLQTAPLNSIVSGIGLNDKFLYIRELFNGDNTLYNNTIRQLETAKSLDDAMDFIHKHFEWDTQNETTQKFVNLLHRRHGDK